MDTRSEWISQAREALHADGSGQERALAILRALNELRPLVQTDAEGATLREMQLSTIALAVAPNVEGVALDDLRRLAGAWLAFEQAWEGGSVAG